MSAGYAQHSSISMKTLALHAAAAVFALGAAAIASHALQTRDVAPDTMLTASAPVAATPERIAGLIEPAIRASAEAAQPLLQAVATPTPPVPAARPLAIAAANPALPPLPHPRPCIECATAETIAAAPAADPVPVVSAQAELDGPVPPAAVGAVANADVSPAGLVMRGGQAVVDGGLQAVGTAWSVSGSAVDSLFRTVRGVSF